MSNFGFLENKKEYSMFAQACIDAELTYAAAPVLCAAGCRKALELAVKWVYAADTTMDMPKGTLRALISEPSFRDVVEPETWQKLSYIVKIGNLAVHTEGKVARNDALVSLKWLFEFIEWIDYCYGADYEERAFDESLIPPLRSEEDARRIREQQGEIKENAEEIERLRSQVEEMSARLTAHREEHRQEREFKPEDMSEAATRKLFIDADMKLMGWKFDGAEVREEFKLDCLGGVPGKRGKADYVLFGRDGLPLAVVEAKRTSKDARDGETQAKLYADALELTFGRRPMMFMTNGYETFFRDDLSAPKRLVSGVFSRDDLEKLMVRRASRKRLSGIAIDDAITDRYYQKAAARAVCDEVESGRRRHLLVMATGTGKTRTAASVVDVLSRGGWVTNVLFLADRTALVEQAKDSFKAYLPDMSRCNLCTEKAESGARVVFSTYPTMMNCLDDVDAGRTFSPAHFDLIIIDESHRSIFKKYRAIFGYFDAMVLGLTATPKTDVDRNTYDFFERPGNVPTFAYDYKTAVETDGVLVPYYSYIVKTKFLEKGIKYDDLSDEDKKRFEDDFKEDGDELPDFVPSADMNRFVFNKDTVDTVINDLMRRGIRTCGGDRLGKTIIFAQNKKHAEFIVERFDALYPQYKGAFAKRVVCGDSHVQSVINDFKRPDSAPHIAVSVDMLDTGIDVPECVNLVFFKSVRSKTKFWQMIGRGTRLCPDLDCTDCIDGRYTGKRRFMIFDYCGNFEFFGDKQNGIEGSEIKSLSEMIFSRRATLIRVLQDAEFSDDAHRAWRAELVETCRAATDALNPAVIAVKLKLRTVVKFKDPAAWESLDAQDVHDLTTDIAPLVAPDGTDEYARAFDNFIYAMMIDMIEKSRSLAKRKRSLAKTADALGKRGNIPQVAEKLPVINEVQTQEFMENAGLLDLERVRKELRPLIRFLVDKGHRTVFTSLDDPVIGDEEGVEIDTSEDLVEYRERVDRYVNEHRDNIVIYKLMHNKPLTQQDFRELERVLTEELGTKDDYSREFGDMPFGLMVRKITKLDHGAAMEAFSAFINDAALNSRQIAFVEKVINYIENNGYMEDISVLTKPPFDKPVAFVRLFPTAKIMELRAAIDAVRANAAVVEPDFTGNMSASLRAASGRA